MKSPLPDVEPSAALQAADRMLRAGRHADAATALRRALDLAPADPLVTATVARISGLARSLLTAGRAQDVTAVLAPLVGSAHANGSVLMLYGRALVALGRNGEAEPIFRRWAQLEPGNRDAALTLAAVLADSGRSPEAETLVRADIARSGASPDAAFILGRSLLGQARFDEAEAEFRKVVHAKPDHQIAQANLMELVWMRTADVGEAGRAIDQAVREQPGLLALRIIKARLLVSARLPREALAEIDAGLAVSKQAPALLTAAATIALDFDGTRALGYAKRLSGVSPHTRAAQIALGNASLATGHVRDALELAESLHRADPTDGRALAMKADALRMSDDPRCRELLDYKLVRAESIDIPEGWDRLDAYLAELVDDLGRSHTLRAHPIGNSLRDGSQIELLPQQSSFASIRAFPQAIDGPIRRYMAAIGRGSDPMRRRNAANYLISGMWSVRLRPAGFHVNHYHPRGWISSACYLHLPPAI
ncbi:MAG: tetratricopeptide repeat protein, partial [Rhodanobacteraceae bacterium]